jgi:hypothetical protein
MKNSAILLPQERELSALQRQHLTQLIAVMNVAQGRLDGVQRVTQEQVAAAEKERDQARDQAHAFLNYCAAELGITFTSGEWNFDQQQMVFLPVTRPTDDLPADPYRGAIDGEAIHVNGTAT